MDNKKGLDFNQNNIYITYKLKYTQTELSGPESSCQSCDLACNIIKSFIYQIRSIVHKYNIESDVEKQIVNIKKTIFELSQWTAMQEWSRALLSDMQKIDKLIDTINIEKNQLDQQYHDKFNEYNEIEEKYRILNVHLSKRNKKDDLKYETLQKAHAELTHKNTTLLEKLHKLEKLMIDYRQKIEKCDHNTMVMKNDFEQKIKLQMQESTNEINQFKEIIQNHTKTIDQLNEKNTQLQNEQNLANEKYEAELSDLRMMLTKKNTEVLNLKQCNDELDNLKKNFEQKLEEQERKIIDLENNLQEAFEKESKLRLLIELKEQEVDTSQWDDYSDQQSSQIHLSGNPLEDMKTKLNINKKQIEILNKENETLRQTIDKLSKMDYIQGSLIK